MPVSFFEANFSIGFSSSRDERPLPLAPSFSKSFAVLVSPMSW
jgi:hypothetical protein